MSWMICDTNGLGFKDHPMPWMICERNEAPIQRKLSVSSFQSFPALGIFLFPLFLGPRAPLFSVSGPKGLRRPIFSLFAECL